MTLPIPAGFSFGRAVQGHGWFDLPPFQWEPEASRLTRPIRIPGGRPATVRVAPKALSGGTPGLRIEVTGFVPIGRGDMRHAIVQVGHMMRLDEDLEAFYRLAEDVRIPDLSWIAPAGAGRLLRSPTVFEDLVKMICTTNCTWALTKVMVVSLVKRLGEEAPQGLRLFPQPEAMAVRSARFYRDVIRAGYRGPFLRELARRVACGEIDPEGWLDPARSTEEIRRAILSVNGAGAYVADNMLKLLGRYDGLGIDSWCRRKFSRMYHRGRAVGDRRIEKFYGPFGRWRGLALWCDITKDWFDGEQRVIHGGEKLAHLDY